MLERADYQATCAWYTRHFGFIPSDVQVLPDGSPAVAFMRLDLSNAPADHHTLALAQGFAPIYSRSATRGWMPTRSAWGSGCCARKDGKTPGASDGTTMKLFG